MGKGKQEATGRSRPKFGKAPKKKWMADRAFTAKVEKAQVKLNEKKFYDPVIASTVDTTGIGALTAPPSIFDPAVGTTDSTRIGDMVTIISVGGRYTIGAGGLPGVGDAFNVVRVVIFQWKSQTAPTFQDIWQGVNNPLTSFTHDSAGQFNVLWDRLHVVSPESNSAESVVIKSKRLIWGGKVHFVSGSTAGSGKIYLAALSDSAGAPHPSINFYGRIRYVDS